MDDYGVFPHDMGYNTAGSSLTEVVIAKTFSSTTDNQKVMSSDYQSVIWDPSR